jgi:PhnB protein
MVVTSTSRPLICVMLAVADAPTALAWYKRALGATELWNLGSVVGMEIDGAPVFLGEPERNGWETPSTLGAPSARVEVFCDDPDALIARALAAGATGSLANIRNHQMPWGPHRQGSFIDPFGHKWLVGDRSPLRRHP